MTSKKFTIGTDPDGSRHIKIHARGLDVLDDPQINRGTAFTFAERDHLGLHGLLPHGTETLDEQVARSLRAVPGLRDRRRQVDLPHQPARQQRGALLQARRRARPRDASDRLHADRRRCDPAVQPPLPPSPRAVPQHRRHRRDRQGAGRHRARRRRHRPDRRLGRRGHPRDRRLGCRRHRHLHRQARRLHGRRRHRPRAGARGRSRRRHQPRRAAQRPPLPRPAPLARAGREVRRVHRHLRRQRHRAIPERDPALGGLLRPAGARHPREVRRHALHLRRRHPRHRRGRPRLRAVGRPGLRRPPRRPADRRLRRGLGRRRHRRPDRAGDDRGRPHRGGGRRPDLPARPARPAHQRHDRPLRLPEAVRQGPGRGGRLAHRRRHARAPAGGREPAPDDARRDVRCHRGVHRGGHPHHARELPAPDHPADVQPDGAGRADPGEPAGLDRRRRAGGDRQPVRPGRASTGRRTGSARPTTR